MAEAAFDFAILGSTPLSHLVAGLLASAHGRKVVLVGRPPSPFLPPPGLDLSVAPLTRPETWALLKTTVPEVVRLLTAVDRRLVRRVDPHFTANTGAGIEALGHVRHVAGGYGHAVERLASRGAGTLLRIRDVALLDRRRCDAVLPRWCSGVGVVLADPAATTVSFRRDSSVRLENAGTVTEVARAVLADDAAILAALKGALPDWLVLGATTSILTEPVRAADRSTVVNVDAGVVLSELSAGGLVGIAPGLPEVARALVGRGLSFATHVAGESSFGRVIVRDGGPFVGPLRNPRATAIAGFELVGAFLAPALARHLADAAGPGEAEYFAAREGGATRGAVGEWVPLAPQAEPA